MASFRFEIRQGKRGRAKKHCDYILREGHYSQSKLKDGLIYKEAGNLPPWAESASDFFAAADFYERKNGNAYTEFIISLPYELTAKENIALVREFTEKTVGAHKAYAFAVHDTVSEFSPGRHNVHAHIMFSEKIILDKEHVKPKHLFFRQYNSRHYERGGYLKDPRFTSNIHVWKENVREMRRVLADTINGALARKGLGVRVSPLSLKEQRALGAPGRERLPGVRLTAGEYYHVRRLVREKGAEGAMPYLSERCQVFLIGRRLKEAEKEYAALKKRAAKERREEAARAAARPGKFISVSGMAYLKCVWGAAQAVAARIKSNEKELINLSGAIRETAAALERQQAAYGAKAAYGSAARRREITRHLAAVLGGREKLARYAPDGTILDAPGQKRRLDFKKTIAELEREKLDKTGAAAALGAENKLCRALYEGLTLYARSIKGREKYRVSESLLADLKQAGLDSLGRVLNGAGRDIRAFVAAQADYGRTRGRRGSRGDGLGR